jgi:hypothetical protein
VRARRGTLESFAAQQTHDAEAEIAGRQGRGEVEARKRGGTLRRKSSGRASARGKPLDGSSTASSEFAGTPSASRSKSSL